MGVPKNLVVDTFPDPINHFVFAGGAALLAESECPPSHYAGIFKPPIIENPQGICNKEEGEDT